MSDSDFFRGFQPITEMYQLEPATNSKLAELVGEAISTEPVRKDVEHANSATEEAVVDMEVEPEDPLIATKLKVRKRKAESVQKVHGTVKKAKRTQISVSQTENKQKRDPEVNARRYQLEVLNEAQKRNIIVYLETGCGKTLIAVLLIKSLAYKLRVSGQKRIVVFLVPTVHLVHQQSEVLEIHTDFKLGRYWGAKGVDFWSAEVWEKEISSNEVLVMTPQIFLDLLLHSLVKLDMVELLVIDECHHTQKKHPYCKIMNEYREASPSARPKIFGMTASPVIRKGVTSTADCQEQLVGLEKTLDSKVFTVKDRSELESFLPTPNTEWKYYDKPTLDIQQYQSRLLLLAEKYQSLETLGFTEREQFFKDDQEYKRRVQKTINRLRSSLSYCLQELGFWSACKAAEILLKQDGKDMWDSHVEILQDLKKVRESFLKDALEVLLPGQTNGDTKICTSKDDLLDAVKAGFVTPKIALLVDVLMNYRNVVDMRCIVFVDRVVAALVLASLTNQIGCLSFLRSEYLAGISGSSDVMTRSSQQQSIELFRSGKVNLLVATNVAEEGLDIQSCNSVIRFDGCVSVRSYIQSRGRARRPGSDYFVFLERENEKQEKSIKSVVISEQSMREQAMDRKDAPLNPRKHQKLCVVESYRVGSTGATMNTDSSVAFIYRFCAKLPGDKYYTPSPEFMFHQVESQYVCVLKLPSSAPVCEVTGPARKSAIIAKQAVCLEACKILHTMGAITDYLLPALDDKEIEEQIMNLGTTKFPGAGTTWQKELHESVPIAALQGSWGVGSDGATLNGYKLSFIESSTVYADFALLLEARLDDDVAQLEVGLELPSKKVNAKLSPLGRLHLSPNELTDAKEFQGFLFNGLFYNLLRRYKGSASPTKKLVPSISLEEKAELWSGDRLYLLLPLTQKHTINSSLTDWSLDWKCIRDASLTSRVLRSFYVNEDSKNIGNDEGWMADKGHGQIQMACGLIAKESDVVNSVVLAVHTGRFYVVTSILQDKTASSAFTRSCGLDPPKYSSYIEFFEHKHGQLLKHVSQPLLQVKPTHRLHNVLPRCLVKKGKFASKVIVSEKSYVELPPELCLITGISSLMIRAIYLIPSFLHRLDAALRASQLRQIVRMSMPHCPIIPVFRIVEALTTLRCLENFSMEGLELLGDSFLKYAVSKYLYLMYENKHEGQLSTRRSHAISNAKLHCLGLIHSLPGYIRDEVFDPSCWVAPGMKCLKPRVCRCNLKNLNILGNKQDKPPRAGLRDKVYRIGKSCSNGHRWLCSKVISDTVEALIGAYLVEGDDPAALDFMSWAGIAVEVDPCLVEHAQMRSSVNSLANVGVDLEALETRLNYSFSNKSLLVEAITHASYHGLEGSFCYQRLEFLGDAILDLLITKNLFFSYPGLSPGQLTDLRSASVNNECFARVAVKHNFNKYIRHASGMLLTQVQEFVRIIQTSGDDQKNSSFGLDGVQAPKVLGDILESIAGAILVDTFFNVNRVWEVMRPLLPPILSPDALPLHPIRELQELCQLRNFSLLSQVDVDGPITHASFEVTVGSESLHSSAGNLKKKSAQKYAAQKLLAILEGRGFVHSSKVSASKHSSSIEGIVESDNVGIESNLDMTRHEHNSSIEDIVESGNVGIESNWDMIRHEQRELGDNSTFCTEESLASMATARVFVSNGYDTDTVVDPLENFVDICNMDINRHSQLA